jgi:hypothetical protein
MHIDTIIIDTMLFRWTHQILNKIEGHKNHCKDMSIQQTEQNESSLNCENGVVEEQYKCKKIYVNFCTYYFFPFSFNSK